MRAFLGLDSWFVFMGLERLNIADLEKQKDMDLIYSSVKKSFSKFKKIPAGSLINCLKSCHSNAMLLNETSGALLDERS